LLSGRGLCDELITRPEESYRLWCVVVCDLETSWIRRPWPALGHGAKGGKKTVWLFQVFCDVTPYGMAYICTGRYGMKAQKYLNVYHRCSENFRPK